MSLNSPLNTPIDVSIIIVNYNLTKELDECLNSLIANIKASTLNIEIIVVDNNSPNKDLVQLEKKINYENISFFYLDKNLGFGKGCNYGYTLASGKYICFLNPDTLIEEDIFSPILELFESDGKIGIIGPQQQVRKPFFDFSAGYSPNIFFELFNLFGLGVFLEGFLIVLITSIIKNKVYNVNWVLGACLFIRSDVFDEINGFDRDYFMFFEEVDLCKRVISIGLKIIYYPNLKINHIGSVASKKDYRLYTIRTYSSKNIYISKHYKLLYKFLMRFFLFTQLFSQVIIWTILYPLNNQKSKQKINSFIYLIKHNITYEHRY